MFGGYTISSTPDRLLNRLVTTFEHKVNAEKSNEVDTLNKP